MLCLALRGLIFVEIVYSVKYLITNFLSQRFAAENIYRADKAIVIHPAQYFVKISKNV